MISCNIVAKVCITLLLSVSLPATQSAAQTSSAAAAAANMHSDLTGDWQGTLQAGKSLRLIVRITKADKSYAARFYSIDQGGASFNSSSMSVDGTAVKFSLDAIGGGYDGTVSQDGGTMTGTWTQGGSPFPLTLVRATAETAWVIPAPPAPPARMPVDASPVLDVATIKPNNSGAATLQGIGFGGGRFMAQAASLIDLICVAYSVQKKQITGAPEWADHDRYDISGKPDVEGMPSLAQMNGMMKKLIAERFKLTFHPDKRELSAYVLTVAKTGPKVKRTETGGAGPGFGMQSKPGGLSIPVRNADMNDLAGFLQSLVLDRPVVNKTDLTDHYDFTLTFTPDDSEFNGHPPPQPAKTDTTEVAPSIFDAMQQQLGLKLDPQKTQVAVMAIDHVEKPSAN